VLERAAADPRPAGAILATGDLSQDETRGAYDRFRTLLAQANVPVWCLPGNHDAPLLMAEVLTAPPFHVGGALLAGNWCVVLLNSHLAGDHGGRLAASELEWLDAMLKEHSERHVLLAVHHHVLKLGSRWLDELDLHNSADLIAVVDRAPQIRAVVAGHVHQASDITRNGVRYLTTPSTCFQFLPAVDSFAVDTRPPGFRWLDLMADGRIDTEVVWIEPPQ
jgi:Icc protein